MMPDGWAVVSDKQRIGHHLRRLIVEGPGIQVARRRYWLTWNARSKRLRENDCIAYARRQEPTIGKAIGEHVRATEPQWIWDGD